MKPSFSLKWLFVAVAAAALTVTALLNANDVWAILSSFAVLACASFAAISVAFFGRRATFSIGLLSVIVLAHQTGLGYQNWLYDLVKETEYFAGDGGDRAYAFTRIIDDLTLLAMAAVFGWIATWTASKTRTP